jgi:hypothetical protein
METENNKEEIYKPITEYENYSISNLGNIKNNITNKILKIQTSSRYSTIHLSNGLKLKGFTIHRLVAQAFIPNPENKLTVNHKNHNTYDNKLENLEWYTHKEQIEFNYLTEPEKRTTTRARSVMCVDKKTENKKEFRTMAEASVWLFQQCKSKSVDSCLAGIRHSINNSHYCHGYMWKYNDLEQLELDNEIWKEIPEELTLGKKNYWISNKGRFKNNKGKIINMKHNCNYLTVSFRNKNKTNAQLLHRIVAQLFVSNPENKPFVNHINGIKDNNCADNLEWVTKSENTKHAYETGLIKRTCRKINQYTKDGIFIAHFESIKLASVTLKIDKSSIAHVCAKDRSGSVTCGGFVFKYAEQDDAN